MERADMHRGGSRGIPIRGPTGGSENRNMRSIRGLLAAIILLLTVPLALAVAIVTGGGAEPIVHFGIGAGMVLLATAAFDYDLPRPMAWFGAVTTGAFGAI